MTGTLKDRILSNTFVDSIRSELRFDDAEYEELCVLFAKLAETLRTERAVEKELALLLYSAPQMVRNAFLSLATQDRSSLKLSEKLEDAWMKLDALVLKCLK